MMKNLMLLLSALCLVQSVQAVGKYPQDVATFVVQKEQCDYLRGEISGQAQADGARDLNQQLAQYCNGTDQQLSLLKLKYTDNQSIRQKLDSYEFIECQENCNNN